LPSCAKHVETRKRTNGDGDSVREAYCTTIEEAESFVYIENQYFIDLPDGPQHVVTSIVNRIKRAYTEKKPFKIVVVLPQYPDNGDLTKPNSANSLMVMSNQRATLKSIDDKLYTFAKTHIAHNYISYYSLRNYGVLGNRIVTEQIYVHSKVMISDKATVVGSANINSRSLFGDRDTELAVWVKSPKFSTALMRRLVSEHLGKEESTIPENLLDVFSEWDSAAENNKKYYVKLFHKSIPDGEPSNIVEYKASEVEAEHLPILEQNIRGHVVVYPSGFLVEELGGKAIEVKSQFVYNIAQSTADIFN